MSKIKRVDMDKKANRRCANCTHFDGGEAMTHCSISHRQIYYWNCCKGFEWNKSKDLMLCRTVSISPELYAQIQTYLSPNTPPDARLDEDNIISITAKFSDGKEMDIKCCGVQDGKEPAWTEAVLFDENGWELCFTDPNDVFIGSWELEDDGIMYRAIVEIA